MLTEENFFFCNIGLFVIFVGRLRVICQPDDPEDWCNLNFTATALYDFDVASECQQYQSMLHAMLAYSQLEGLITVRCSDIARPMKG